MQAGRTPGCRIPTIGLDSPSGRWYTSMQMTAPQPISLTERRGGTTRVRVYASLRDAIVRAELAPGRQLSENELAALARRQPHARSARRCSACATTASSRSCRSSARSSPASATRAVADAQFIREALECAAVRAAAERADRRATSRRSRRTSRAQERARERARLRRLLRARRRSSTSRCATSAATRSSGRSASAPRATSTACAGSASRMPELPRRDGRRAPRDRRRASAAHDPDGAEAALRHHLRMVLRERPAHPRAAPRLLRGGLMADRPWPRRPDRHRSTQLRQMDLIRALRDRGRAPVQGRPDRRLLPPLLRARRRRPSAPSHALQRRRPARHRLPLPRLRARPRRRRPRP